MLDPTYLSDSSPEVSSFCQHVILVGMALSGLGVLMLQAVEQSRWHVLPAPGNSQGGLSYLPLASHSHIFMV